MSRPPATKLCTACRHVFYGSRKQGESKKVSVHYKHHDDVLMLEVEARKGCRFCLLLWNMLTENEQTQILTKVLPLFNDGGAIKYSSTNRACCTYPTEYEIEEVLGGGYKIQYTFIGKGTISDKWDIKKRVTLSPASGNCTGSSCSRSHLTRRSNRSSACGR